MISLDREIYESAEGVRYNIHEAHQKSETSTSMNNDVSTDRDSEVCCRRKPASIAATSERSIASSTEDQGNEESMKEKGEKLVDAERHRDPLKWFGILAPPALRQSQINFQEGLSSLTSIH